MNPTRAASNGGLFTSLTDVLRLVSRYNLIMPSDQIISYWEMCAREGVSLQHGMNFFDRSGHSVLLACLREGAPYDDRLEEGGTVLIYEGHDEPRTKAVPEPKVVDQPLRRPSGNLTPNGRFQKAAFEFKAGVVPPRRVRVYEKIKNGIWSYNGLFLLTDSWTEQVNGRVVFKFRLQATEDLSDSVPVQMNTVAVRRVIPSAVKLEVWRRDKGQCVRCGSTTELHFDHILPFAKGGSSITDANVQLLCARHNLSKGARIE